MLRFGITVNDQKKTVWRGTSIEKLVEKGYANPTPGNLMAVDGSLLEEGKGQLCTATIDGTPAELNAKVHRGAVVTIGDGEDVTEEHTTTQEAIPYGTSSSSREFDAYWNGSIHLLSDGQEGERTIKTGKVSGKTVNEVTKPAIDKGYIIYTAKPKDKVIALTFDDGPWPETTGQILDILEQYGAKATFFTIGNQIAERPEELVRAKSLGCEVCTHTYDHAAGAGGGVNITYMSASEQINDVQKGFAAIADATGEEPPHVMRAPGGNFYGEAIDNLWPYLDAEIGWDVDTEDWRQPGSDAIAEAILSVQPGQVILMHDGGGDRTQTVEALRIALPKLVEQGYGFVTVDELMAYGMPESEDGVINLG